MERKIREELASAFARLGQFGNAAAELDQLAVTIPSGDPQRIEIENTRSLFSSLRDVAVQTVEFGPEVSITAKRNPFGSWDIPVEVNGKKGQWTFDTGANFSTLSESEASRMGMAVHETVSDVTSSHTGIHSRLRVTVADNLLIGSTHLHNVVFLVLPDEALHFGKYQVRGLLGLPAIRALGRVSFSAKGAMRVQESLRGGDADRNLFFEGLSLVVEVHHSDRPRMMILDTGANRTYLYPSFLDALDPRDLGHVRRGVGTSGGAGGTVKQDVEIVPTAQVQLAGSPLQLRRIRVQPGGSFPHEDGLLAADALARGFTLDFKAMRLRLN
jgi:predicted aspartyl protease